MLLTFKLSFNKRAIEVHIVSHDRPNTGQKLCKLSRNLLKSRSLKEVSRLKTMNIRRPHVTLWIHESRTFPNPRAVLIKNHGSNFNDSIMTPRVNSSRLKVNNCH